MEQRIARQVAAAGTDPELVAGTIVDALAGPDLKIAFLFADWRLEPGALAGAVYRGLRAPVVGGTTVDVVGQRESGLPSAVALGLYGDWARIGIGVAQDLPKAALAGSRDAVNAAAVALGRTAETLDPARHVAITILDGTCGHEESFCIGSAAAAPKIRFVGGCTATEVASPRRARIWVNGEVMSDAGVVIALESTRPFHVLTSAHLVPTNEKTIVTACAGRVIHELDGLPAASRLRALVRRLGETLDEPAPSHTFARYVDGLPYQRSIAHIEGESLYLASAVERGHVLRLMRPGDLIGTTRRDLAAAAEKVGGTIDALLAFSCMGRHWEAHARGLTSALAEVYAAYPTIGFQSFGEQSGMLLVNHTLTGVAIGGPR